MLAYIWFLLISAAVNDISVLPLFENKSVIMIIYQKISNDLTIGVANSTIKPTSSQKYCIESESIFQIIKSVAYQPYKVIGH